MKSSNWVNILACIQCWIKNIQMIHVGKQIPSKYIPLGTVEPLKETKKMLEDKNQKQVRRSTEGKLKNKYIPRYERGKHELTYDYVVSTWKLSNEREK